MEKDEMLLRVNQIKASGRVFRAIQDRIDRIRMAMKDLIANAKPHKEDVQAKLDELTNQLDKELTELHNLESAVEPSTYLGRIPS